MPCRWQFILWACAVVACGAPPSTPQGSEGGACYDNGRCDAPLVCAEGVCRSDANVDDPDIEQLCSDGEDNDSNGFVDCADPDCFLSPDCLPAGCGDELLAIGEQCDRNNLRETCASLGLLDGEIGCAPNCVIDVSGCFGCGTYPGPGGFECSLCSESNCCDETAACYEGSACASLLACKNLCVGDDSCISQCESEHPLGVAAAAVLQDCVGTNCDAVCPGGVCGTLLTTGFEALDECITNHAATSSDNGCCDAAPACLIDGDCTEFNDCVEDPCPSSACDLIAFMEPECNRCVDTSCCSQLDACIGSPPDFETCFACLADPSACPDPIGQAATDFITCYETCSDVCPADPF